MEKFKKALPSLFFLLVAAVFFYGTFSIKQTTSGNLAVVSAATYPRVMIAFLAIMGFWILAQDVFLAPSGGQQEASSGATLPLLACIGVTLASILLLKTLGGVITGTAFLAGMFLLLERQPLTRKLVVKRFVLALVLGAAFSYLFRYGFGIRLPLYPSF